jgi:hypothetical protein
MLIPIAACIGLGALSLLLPSEPSYDPWAWFVWGREISHFELDTAGGPSWKPLPVVLLAFAAPLGDDVAPAIWIALARAGALLGLVLAYRLAARFAGGPPVLRAVAGTTAAIALALTPDWFQFTAHASEAPLAVALMLWAVERHLDGRRGQALALLAVVSLMRPELFPFLAIYAIWLWRAERGLRGVVVALMVAIPLAWLVPEWIGSGDPLDGGSQARSEPYWSLSHAERPWLRALERLHNHAGTALELLALAAVAAAVVRRQRAVLVLAAAAAVEGALFVAMTQAGFSGNPRYALPALAVLCVLAGTGAARTAEAGGALAARTAGMLTRWRGGTAAAGASAPRRPRLLAASSMTGVALALTIVALLVVPLVESRAGRLEFEAREVDRRMDLQRGLARAIDAAGGAEALRELGSATTNRALHSRLAWELGYPIQDVERGYGHRVVFRTSDERIAGDVLVWGRPRERRMLARAGSFDVYRRIGVRYRLFTSPLQGLHIWRSVARTGGAG